MELPHLGKHCSEKSCRQLDFLPMKCDACSEIFCKDHLQYDDHNCSSSYKKNIQVIFIMIVKDITDRSSENLFYPTTFILAVFIE